MKSTGQTAGVKDWEYVLGTRTRRAPGVARPGKTLGAALMDAPAYGDTFVSESEMCAIARITTPTPDRSEDVVEPMGIMLDNYRKNPVVLWDHGMSGLSMPIGKSEDPTGNLALTITEEGIDAGCYFAQGMFEACQIFELVVQKIVRATSIGFRPIEAEVRSRGQDRPGLLISLWELFEWSWVAVPDNPDALAKILQKGKLAGRPICEPILKSLAPLKPAARPYGTGWTPPADYHLKAEMYRRKGKEMREQAELQEAIEEFRGAVNEAALAVAARVVEDLKEKTEALVAAVRRRTAADSQSETGGESGVEPGATASPGPVETEPEADPRLA
jgi:hypothetical protein